jgi:CHAD domain-containing protein
MAKQPVERLREHALRVHHDVSMMLDTDGPLEEDAIHGLRVAAKEVRALWQLLKPLLDDARAEQAIGELRDAAATLSEARDQYVVTDTLSHLLSRARSRDASEALGEALLLLRQRHPEDSTRTGASRMLSDCWQHDSQRWQTLKAEINNSDLIHEGYGRLYRKAYKLTHSAIATDDIQLWHALRKWVKYLALTLPLLGKRNKLEMLTEDITRLGKKLGRLHDLDRLLLESAALEWPENKVDQRAYVNHLIRCEISRALEGCTPLAKELFDQAPGKFINELRRISD